MTPGYHATSGAQTTRSLTLEVEPSWGEYAARPRTRTRRVVNGVSRPILPWFKLAALILGALLLGCPDDPAPPVPSDDDDDDDDTVADDDDSAGDDDDSARPSGPWVRAEREAPGSITFTELSYNPPSGPQDEWIELFNPMVLDMDLSGWRIEGGVDFLFADGTVLPALDYLVVAADPAALAAQMGSPGALGPFVGRLSNGGERLELRNNTGRLIDTVAYGDDAPWPVEADGSGLTLAKIDADAASDRAEHWRGSATLLGTPGAPNLLDPAAPSTTVELLPMEATWSYELSGALPGLDWAAPDFDAGIWPTGEAVFYAGSDQAAAWVTARATADNYFALYLGAADGSDLRLVGEDSDGDWWTAEPLGFEVGPLDHLYLAAWEASWSSEGPQMVIAEADLPYGLLGTDALAFEWVLGPTGGAPGTQPSDPSPAADGVALLVEEANAAGSWAAPSAEAPQSAGPWGGSLNSSFAAGTNYLWGDTFDDVSATNTENTYALFRSETPLLAGGGTTELPSIPITSYFRTAFTLLADPASTELTLQCVIDDGAAIYLNGVEVFRHNLPGGSLAALTLASTSVAWAGELVTSLPSDALVPGPNLLAVELHQAAFDDEDLRFGCSLSARITPALAGRTATVVVNEIPPGGTSPFWVELIAASPQDLDGLVLTTSQGVELVLPGQALEAGERALVEDLGASVAVGDVLFLYSADRETLLDAVRVQAHPRARSIELGPWRTPREATPGAPNVVDTQDSIVIHEIQYHRTPTSAEAAELAGRAEEWIELTNRGPVQVDLSGWQLVDDVGFAFPAGTVLAPDAHLVVASDAAALRTEHPGIVAVGDFVGSLGNAGGRILLLDALGNPADEVRYVDGGRWPQAADGGGSSLELRDPWADNAAGEAWAASDEAPFAQWVTTTYRGPLLPSAVGPDGVWHELVLGLLDTGEVLVDDLSVIADPDGAAVELLDNGGFDDGSAAWRLLGNHRHGGVVPDPEDPGNPVLRLVATGSTGHMHNHVETTLLQPLEAPEVEISFRARWVSGSNQLNTRLYFNRLARTTLLPQPERSGTPGQPNSTAVANLGPTFSGLQHEPAVPLPGAPIPVRVLVDDPDGVAAVTLWSSAAGAPFVATPMTEASGRWAATLPGQGPGAIVQIYVEAEDGLGELATFPAAGPASRALIQVEDGRASTTGLHDFRIVMTQADSDWMHAPVNLMSDDTVGATVVSNETEVFYDVGVRPKGSERGRPSTVRLGYGVRFNPEQPFRGSHRTVLLDRSQGVDFGQREVLLNLAMAHAGSVSAEYNDLVHALTPRPEHTGPAELQLDRFSALVLDAQFVDGGDGTRFEYELIYFPVTTDTGSPDGLKLPEPDGVIGVPLIDLGPDKEAYRWNFLIKNNEREDDYSGVIDLCQAFGVWDADSGAAAKEVIDVDQWLRAFAFATLSGTTDQYGGVGSEHNAQFYVRPEDGKVLYFPHDLDFFDHPQMAVVGNGDLARLIADPLLRRAYYGHLWDLVDRAYNREHLEPWCTQLGALLPGQDFDGYCSAVDIRADWVVTDSWESITAVYPPGIFRITTEGGADFSVEGPEVVLEGDGWIDVRSIALATDGAPLALTWLDDLTWQVTVPLGPGPNELVLRALDARGAVVGSDAIGVTSIPGP